MVRGGEALKQAIPHKDGVFVPKKSANKNFNMVALQTIKKKLNPRFLPRLEEAFQVCYCQDICSLKCFFFIVKNSLLVATQR